MWSRLDWKRGRWNINTETTLIHRGLRGWQRETGDSFSYFRFQYDDSEIHPVYDEGVGVGKRFYGRWEMPALHVIHTKAANEEPRDSGLYITDNLHVICEFDQLTKLGFTEMDLKHGAYQRDRIAYNNLLFAVKQVTVQGQIRRRDIIVGIDAEQLKNDELVNDPQFASYLRDPYQNPDRQISEELLTGGSGDDPYS